MRGEGIPVSWQYPRTPGDINPYLITLKKAHTKNERLERTVPLKRISTQSHNYFYKLGKEDSHTAALKLRHMLDTPCNSVLECHRSFLPKAGNAQQEPHIVYDINEYCSPEKNHPARHKEYDCEKKTKYYCHRLSKEFHKLKNELEDLKRTVLSIKSECSYCNNRKFEQIYNNKRNRRE